MNSKKMPNDIKEALRVEIRKFFEKYVISLEILEGTLETKINFPDYAVNSFYFGDTCEKYGSTRLDRSLFWTHVCNGSYDLFYKTITLPQTITIGEEKFII